MTSYNSISSGLSIYITHVEDNDGDILLTQDALAEVGINARVDVLKDGKAAVDYFAGLVNNEVRELPDLVLLDINLPRQNGHEVLKFIRAQDRLKLLPVIMFTTSSSPLDMAKSYSCGANAYITKPVDVEEFIKAVGTIGYSWRELCNLPPKK